MLANDEDKLQLVRAITEETREDKTLDLQVLVPRPARTFTLLERRNKS